MWTCRKMTCTSNSLVEALEDLRRAWIRGSIDVSWLSPLKNENVLDDLKPIVVPVWQFYSTPFRSYRRRSMYEAPCRLRLLPWRVRRKAAPMPPNITATGDVMKGWGRGGRPLLLLLMLLSTYAAEPPPTSTPSALPPDLLSIGPPQVPPISPLQPCPPSPPKAAGQERRAARMRAGQKGSWQDLCCVTWQ